MAPGDRRGARIRVAVSDERGRPLPAPLGGWLGRVAPSWARGVVNVAVVSDRRVRALNRQYRGQDSTTDVLSFSASHATPLRHWARTARREPEGVLGDIVIARGVARDRKSVV